MIAKFTVAILAVLLNSLMGATLAQSVGIDALTGAGVANVVAVAASSLDWMPAGLRAGVLTEVWTGELVKQLRGWMEATWLNGIADVSSLVNNETIHLVDVGADPTVLINNTTYPLTPQKLTDGDIAINLDKFETEATSVTDDELYALSYDKMGRVRDSHATALRDTELLYAIHALAPQKSAAKAPVIATTGEADGSRKRITRQDIIALKDKFDKLKVPTAGRRLVLCTDHINDLLLQDQKFADQYYNYQTGKISNLYGFEIYEFVGNPYFSTAGVKQAVGKTDEGYQASVAFYAPRVFKATGSTKMYYSDAQTDPLNKRNLISFTQRFVCLPKKADAFGAIYSASV